jgi:hypothetical protein
MHTDKWRFQVSFPEGRKEAKIGICCISTHIYYFVHRKIKIEANSYPNSFHNSGRNCCYEPTEQIQSSGCSH